MKLGSATIAAIKLGAENVTAVYVGTQLAWSATQPCPPYGSLASQGCDGCNYGNFLNDGNCGYYFEATSYDDCGCCQCCPPEGSLSYESCNGCEYGAWRNDGNCGTYFEPFSPNTAGYQECCTPSEPTNYQATAGDGSIALAWDTPAVSGAIYSYDIEYTPSGSATEIVNTGNTDTTYTLTGLTNGTEYEVKVRALNGAGQGSWTAPVLVTPAAPAQSLWRAATYSPYHWSE